MSYFFSYFCKFHNLITIYLLCLNLMHIFVEFSFSFNIFPLAMYCESWSYEKCLSNKYNSIIITIKQHIISIFSGFHVILDISSCRLGFILLVIFTIPCFLLISCVKSHIFDHRISGFDIFFIIPLSLQFCFL